MLLHRKCTTLILKTKGVLSDHTASTCRTKPTETLCVRANIDTTSLRKITRKELHVEKQTLGRGMFGRCYLAHLGPLQVCVKVFRREMQYASTFAMMESGTFRHNISYELHSCQRHPSQ